MRVLSEAGLHTLREVRRTLAMMFIAVLVAVVAVQLAMPELRPWLVRHTGLVELLTATSWTEL